KPFLQGSPAVFVVLGVGVLIWLGNRSTANELRTHYLKQADTALADDRMDEAALFYRKLLQMDSASSEALYGQARVADQQERREDARRIMQRLALDHDHGPAHFWLAEDMLQAGKTLPPDRVQQLVDHLKAASRDPGQHKAQTMLGQILFAKKEYVESLPYFAKAARFDAHARLQLARNLAVLGQTSGARAHAETTAVEFTKLIRQHPDDQRTRLALIDVLVFLGRYGDATIAIADGLKDLDTSQENMQLVMLLSRVYQLWARALWNSESIAKLPLEQALALERGRADAVAEMGTAIKHFNQQLAAQPRDVVTHIRLAELLLVNRQFAAAEARLAAGWQLTREPRLKQAMARAYSEWVQFLWADRAEHLPELIAILERALRAVPNEKVILERLAVLAAEVGTDSSAAQTALKELLASGKAPASVHLILGTAATGAGDLKKALLHLEQAYEAEPHMPAVLNNLAWTLSHLDPPQIDRARKLIDAALAINDQHPEIRATRGEILVMQQEWKLALRDLEFALKSLSDRPDIHAGLAKVYEALGEPELAKLHRRQSGTP
ncbi:MAG: tetratricopeptide repeat protein, partial [Planctomycetota bacterium]|nr:tetratricopeptide repeat protein [Planctomycetota bacterium]